MEALYSSSYYTVKPVGGRKGGTSEHRPPLIGLIPSDPSDHDWWDGPPYRLTDIPGGGP